MATNGVGNPPVALGDVHRTGHYPRHGEGRTRGGDRANQQEYLRSRAGIARETVGGLVGSGGLGEQQYVNQPTRTG